METSVNMGKLVTIQCPPLVNFGVENSSSRFQAEILMGKETQKCIHKNWERITEPKVALTNLRLTKLSGKPNIKPGLEILFKES